MTNEELEQKKRETTEKAFALVEEGKELLGNAFATAYQRALDFMDQGQYKKALDSAQMLESVEEYKKQAKMLKFRIFTICAETFSEEDIEALISIWNGAASCCDSYEEFFSIFNDATLYLRKWLETATQRSFAQQQELIEQVNIHEFPFSEACLRFQDNLSIFNKIIDKMLLIPAFTTLVEKSNMSLDEATDRYLTKRPSLSNILFDESYTAGCRVFDQFTDFVEENKHCSVEYADEVIEKAWFWSSVAVTNLKPLVDASGWDEGKRSAAIKKTIDLCNYYLNALIYPNGKTVSLAFYPQYRELRLKDLEECYAMIQELDFYVPALPDRAPVNEGVQNNSSSGGCYVATAVYGSYDCPQVWTLRRFRDNTLAETWWGRAFIRTYYAISPTLVKYFGKTEWFKKMCQGKLDLMVAKLQDNGVESTPYEDKQW